MWILALALRKCGLKYGGMVKKISECMNVHAISECKKFDFLTNLIT